LEGQKFALTCYNLHLTQCSFVKQIIKNVFAIKSILKCFVLRLGLKVNFQKSRVGGIGVEIMDL